MIEEHEVFVLVRHVCFEVGAYDAMPRGAVLRFKLRLHRERQEEMEYWHRLGLEWRGKGNAE